MLQMDTIFHNEAPTRSGIKQEYMFALQIIRLVHNWP